MFVGSEVRSGCERAMVGPSWSAGRYQGESVSGVKLEIERNGKKVRWVDRKEKKREEREDRDEEI